MSNKETKVPSLPSPGQDPEGFLRAVHEIVGVREGSRGNPLDRGVTFRDLVDAGLAAPNPSFAGKGRIPADKLIRPASGGGVGGAIGTGIKPTLTTPPTPQGVAAVGTFTTVLVTWLSPGYANHAHAEILRADTNDIGQAVVIGSSVGTQYPDAVGEQSDKYYWVRFVSTQGVKGMTSPGVRGKTALSPELVMANLLATTWAPNTNYSLFQYVQPTTPNGMLYRVSQEGTSGATEPIWPTTAGQTKTDGTVRWTAADANERVPFVIGTVNGQPAVVMDTAFIADATITTAKIKEAFLDNLTAIHGTLNFARIERGNVFELTIGDSIRSETFSPFNNEGFIIRNEPGRDPDTPGIREYVAEFYGNTMFSGDIRAARVMGGVIVGSVFGVPSETDNGAFEFISIRGVVSDSVSASRTDNYAIRSLNISGIGPRNFINGYAWQSQYNGWIGYVTPWAGVESAGPYNSADTIATLPPYGTRYHLQRLSNLVCSSAKIRTNPLSIISASAIAPLNYNRYRRRLVNAVITFTRDSQIGMLPDGDFQYGWAYPDLIIRIFKGATNEVLLSRVLQVRGFIGYEIQKWFTQYIMYSFPDKLINFENSFLKMVGRVVTKNTPVSIGGDPIPALFLAAGTTITLKRIDFNIPEPVGMSCELEVAYLDLNGNPDRRLPSGMDCAFTFSTAMDNNA